MNGAVFGVCSDGFSHLRHYKPKTMDEWGCFLGFVVMALAISVTTNLKMDEWGCCLGFVVMALAISVLFRHPLRDFSQLLISRYLTAN